MNSVDRKKRGANITNEQRTLLLEYMNKHPELLKGKFTSSFTLKTAISLWTELAEILNSVNGAKKDWKSWRKCWHDFRSRSKGKHAIIKQSIAATGGGTKNTEILTPQEEQVLNLTCSTSFDGHPDVEESIVNLLEDSDDVDITEVEYLDEDRENILPKIIYTSMNLINNNYNILPSQEVSDNENLNRKHNTYVQIEQASTSKLNQESDEIISSVNNTTVCIENSGSKNAGDEQPLVTKVKKSEKLKKSDTLQTTLEVSANLNNIYEKTYELKKSYYIARLEYLKRSVEENMANIIKTWKMA